MESESRRARICPKCGKLYSDHPALSRMDNETLICPDCGTREALAWLGVDAQEQEEILKTIHRSMVQENTDEFNAMLSEGIRQANNGDSLPLDDAMNEILERLKS